MAERSVTEGRGFLEAILAHDVAALGVAAGGDRGGVSGPSRQRDGADGALRGTYLRLGRAGHHLDALPGVGPAFRQRLLHKRRGSVEEQWGALHVPDRHGNLCAGPAGERPATGQSVEPPEWALGNSKSYISLCVSGMRYTLHVFRNPLAFTLLVAGLSSVS